MPTQAVASPAPPTAPPPPLEDVRYEVKMALAEGQLFDARSRVATAPLALRRQHPTRELHSVYFDTEALDTYWSNLAGSSERHKVRLRWYGPRVPPAGATCRFEVKRKAGVYGWKLVEEVPAPDLGQPWPAVVRSLEGSLSPAMASWLRMHPRAVLLNSYRREYFASLDGRVRLTLDSGNTVFDQLRGRRPNLARSTPGGGTGVLEGKSTWRDRGLLELALQHFPYRVSRNSKYLNGVDAILGAW